MIHDRSGRIILWSGIAVLAAVFAAQQLVADKAWLVLLDNVHWTVGNATAAALAWLGFSRGSGVERAARRWFFIGLAGYLIGQVMWDIQVYIGWNPYPAPSDLFYLMLGPGCLIGLLVAMFQLLPKSNHRITLLDASMMSIAIMTLMLTLYLPRSADIDLLTLSVMTAYPVVLLSASCFGILMVLHVRPRRDWSWITFQIGLGLQGLVWMWWNVQSLVSATVDGSLLNELFSVASIVIGVSAMHWKMVPSHDKRYEKWCEFVLRMLPIVAVCLAALAAMMVLYVENVSLVLQEVVLISSLVVVLLAALRQSVMLQERELLLQAEQKIAASSRFLQLVMDTVPVAIFWKDHNGVYLGCNRIFAEDAGYTNPDEVVGKTDFDLPWGRPESEVYRAEDREVISRQLPKMHITQLRHNAAGEQVWLDTSKVPLLDGELSGVLGVSGDITKRKRDEKLLENAQRKEMEALQELRVMLDTSGEGFWKVTRAGVITETNEAYCRLSGYVKHEILGAHIAKFEAIEISQEMVEQHLQHIIEVGTDRFETKHRHRDGRLLDLEVVTAYIPESDCFIAFLRDVSERKELEQVLRIAAVTFETQEAILITDAEGSILRVNQAFEDITGYSKDDVIGKNPRMFQSGRHDAAFYQSMWSELTTAGKWSGEVWDKRKNGDIYPKAMTITAVYDDQRRVTHYVAVFRDISNRKKSEQEIHQLAFYDPLTKLPNRRLLADRLQQAIAVSVRNGWYGALLFLDLDHFKAINDTQGHAIGDMLLLEVARRLQTCVREGDSVARLGGDEFVVVLEELSSQPDEAAAQTELVAEKIRKELGQPYLLEDYECLTTPSIGICLFLGHHESVDDLLKHADVAMYQAKAAGRNAIRFFDQSMQAILDRREALQVALRHALQRQQFQLYYQIQVDSLLRPLGAEVLLRWNHPERGLIPPAEFIPLAEETGMILPIGLWVLQTACAQLKEWQRDARTCELRLSVNVSAKQFRQPDFVEQVQRVLLESGAMSSHLKLELTESTVLENVQDTIAKMRELRLIGVSFSMDDFGTGYSSLQYLKQLPLDQLKIDQSFVRDIASDPNDAAIVQTIIAMTEALALNVIAEGVETTAQYQFLDTHGCHSFQGYLFSKPLPLQQFETLLNQGGAISIG